MVFSDLLFVALLLLTLALPFISKVPLFTYTPPPLPPLFWLSFFAVFLVMLPPYMVN